MKTNILKKLQQDESGATAIEYGRPCFRRRHRRFDRHGRFAGFDVHRRFRRTRHGCRRLSPDRHSSFFKDCPTISMSLPRTRYGFVLRALSSP